jgi:hypothetical protein
MFAGQVLLFWFLPNIATAWFLTIVTFVVLMCYGGGFGTMPASAADYFGPKNVGPIYGLMLTAWGFASAFGPLFIAMQDQNRHRDLLPSSFGPKETMERLETEIRATGLSVFARAPNSSVG